MGSAEYETVLPAVINCVANVLGISEDGIGAASVLLELGAESLNFMDVAFRLEQEYQIRLPREYTLPDTFTVEKYAIAVIHALKNKQPQM